MVSGCTSGRGRRRVARKWNTGDAEGEAVRVCSKEALEQGGLSRAGGTEEDERTEKVREGHGEHGGWRYGCESAQRVAVTPAVCLATTSCGPHADWSGTVRRSAKLSGSHTRIDPPSFTVLAFSVVLVSLLLPSPIRPFTIFHGCCLLSSSGHSSSRLPFPSFSSFSFRSLILMATLISSTLSS